VTMVRGSPRVAKTVKHILKQGRKAQMVQPVPTEPSVGPEGAIRVVIHLSKTRKKQIIISSTEQIQQTRTQKKPRHNNTSTQILIQTDDGLTKLGCVKAVQNLKNYLIPKYKYTLIRPTVQELSSLQVGEGYQVWTD
jgi:hypothetical protein